MNTESHIEARSRKYAETFYNAEIRRRHDFHSERADKHHRNGNRGAYSVRTATLFFAPAIIIIVSDAIDKNTTATV